MRDLDLNRFVMFFFFSFPFLSAQDPELNCFRVHDIFFFPVLLLFLFLFLLFVALTCPPFLRHGHYQDHLVCNHTDPF